MFSKRNNSTNKFNCFTKAQSTQTTKDLKRFLWRTYLIWVLSSRVVTFQTITVPSSEPVNNISDCGATNRHVTAAVWPKIEKKKKYKKSNKQIVNIDINTQKHTNFVSI